MPPEDDQENEQTETPVGLTAVEVANIVNSAVTSQMKRYEARIAAEFEKKLAAVQAAVAPKETDEAPKKGKSPEFAALEAQLAQMAKRAEEADAKAAAAEKKARDESGFNALKSSLSGKVNPEYLDVLAEHMFHVRKVVDFDENGTPLYKHDENTVLPLANGIDQFLKSDAAKPWRPAPTVSKTNPITKQSTAAPPARTSTSGTGTGSDEDKIKRALAREQEFLAQQKNG